MLLTGLMFAKDFGIRPLQMEKAGNQPHYLFGISSEFIFANSHADQTDALHRLGSKNSTWLVIGIQQNGFEKWHDYIVVLFKMTLRETEAKLTP